MTCTLVPALSNTNAPLTKPKMYALQGC